MPRLEEWEIKKYWEIFQGLNPIDNKLTGEKASTILKNSRLSDEQLSKIWDLSDIDSDGKLDFEEFCITMRLIFDLINGNQKSVPTELPNWLIPASKAHLIQANKAVSTGNNSYDSNVDKRSDELDEDDALLDDFDWYISPTDRSTYEAIYNSNSDNFGRVKFNSLQSFFDSLRKVPKSDISSAWNLVNPKSLEAIDKDQFLVFLHMLNQRENGRRIPRYVPASLRATFSKDLPSYDLDQPVSQPMRHTGDTKRSFADSYLNKIGQGSKIGNDRGTDFSATEGTDWEEVRLRKKLANLEDLLDKASQKSKILQAESDLPMVKYQFEQMLKFKEEQLRSTEKAFGDKSKDLGDIKNDIDLIESQVGMLKEFLSVKEKELKTLQEEIETLRS